METHYIGSIYAKNGSLLYRSSPHLSRVICVKECVAMKPSAKRVSTSRASYSQAPGAIGGEWCDLGMDIRWHDVVDE